MTASRRIVVVGAGAAGVSTAEGLRRRGHASELIVVGDEHASPYDRPPLSKQVLSGAWDSDRAALLPPDRLAAVDADFRHGVTAARLDAAAHVVHLDDGSALDFDELVIASGVRPRRLAGADIDGVLTLRTLGDSLALRTAMIASGRLIIVGAGFIGLEVAATARQLGVEVTIIEPLLTPLASRLGAAAAARLIARHEAEGVELLLGRTVTRFETHNHNGRAVLGGVELDDGTRVPGGVALVAIGTQPNTEWLDGSGLEIADGVVCDEYCRAAPGIWAVGDVARWQHIGLGRTVRVEHRTNATEQAIAVAANMTGPLTAFTPVPYFWTDQYDVKIQLAGFAAAESTEALTINSDTAFVHSFSVGDRLVGALGWNAAKALMPLRRQLALAAGAQ